MIFKVAAHTDIGIKKSVNQDAYSIQIAETAIGETLFTVLCDGIGGLKNGELSSATVVHTFSKWFEQDFSPIINSVFDFQKIAKSWAVLVAELNNTIKNYGLKNDLRTGTTAAVLLLFKNQALMATIGDSRIYHCHHGKVRQLSKDQTVAQREYELGSITDEELKTDKRSHILLQCIGASPSIHLDVVIVDYEAGDLFELCTDGFYRRLENNEISFVANPLTADSEENMKKTLIMLSELVKSRNEPDNITAITVKTE